MNASRIPTTAEQFLIAAAERGTISPVLRRWPAGLVLVQAEVDGQIRRIRIHESRGPAATEHGRDTH